MKEWWEGKIIYIGLLAFALTVLITIYIIIQVGGAYKGGLSNFSNQQKPQELTLKKKKDIKRIIVRKHGEVSCMEVTPDGVIRQYNVCGGELTGAQRLNDSKNIVGLFKLVSESDLATLKRTGGEYYELTIETDTGTQIVYVSAGSGSGGDIVQTIELVQGDVSGASPTPSDVSVPSNSISIISSPSPGDMIIVNPSPTPEPSAAIQQSFECDFIKDETKKPWNVSNFICSTQPSPLLN